MQNNHIIGLGACFIAIHRLPGWAKGIKGTKCVCALCVYAGGILRSHTKLAKCDGRVIYEGVQIQILTKGDSIRYGVRA